jgi:serine/threonine-protein phosphatase 2B catalytic subunit
MAHWHWARKVSRTPLQASRMRKSTSFLLFKSPIDNIISNRRKSDIENERLPPELFDAEEGKTYSSQPQTPSEGHGTPISPTSLTTGLENAIKGGSISKSPASPISPVTPTSAGSLPFKRGHGRQASLGTTMTSPSTRRRSIETTISMIQEAYDGKEVTDSPAPGAAEGPSGLNGNGSGSGASSPRG